QRLHQCMGHDRLSRNLASSVKTTEINPLPAYAHLRGACAAAMRIKTVRSRPTQCAKTVRSGA
ncbi:hypothetical protein SB761_36535, partial [Pseudomonas sp. SIMBA_064]